MIHRGRAPLPVEALERRDSRSRRACRPIPTVRAPRQAGGLYAYRPPGSVRRALPAYSLAGRRGSPAAPVDVLCVQLQSTLGQNERHPEGGPPVSAAVPNRPGAGAHIWRARKRAARPLCGGTRARRAPERVPWVRRGMASALTNFLSFDVAGAPSTWGFVLTCSPSSRRRSCSPLPDPLQHVGEGAHPPRSCGRAPAGGSARVPRPGPLAGCLLPTSPALPQGSHAGGGLTPPPCAALLLVPRPAYAPPG
jgi:hypothetical protein